MDATNRHRRNLLLGCLGCAGLATIVLVAGFVLVGALWGGVSAGIYHARLTELHTRVLEADADDSDRERVLEQLEEVRERKRRAGFIPAMSSIDAMERVLQDRFMSGPESRFIERELARLAP